MKKLLPIICYLLFASLNLYSQAVSWILGPANDYMYSPVSIRNTPLFKASEIKAGGIKTCTIVTQGYNYSIGKNKTDTIYIFNFDTTGNTIQHISFGNWPEGRKDTAIYALLETWSYKKIDSTVVKQEEQTIVTKYYIWAFNYGSSLEDTGIISESVYDKKNRLVEFKQNGTADYFRVNFCGTGIIFHYKYAFGKKDNTIFYQNFLSRKFATFRYSPNRRIVRVYDTPSNRLERKYSVRIKNNSTETIENDRNFITRLKKLYPGSNLMRSMSSRQTGKGFQPSEYLLIYEYFDKSPSTTKTDNSLVINQ